MKKVITLIVFLSIMSFTYGQPWRNMIPNYSFEIHDLSNWNAKPHCINDPTPHNGYSSMYEYIKDYWSVIPEWTHPLRHEPCIVLSPPSVPTADLYDVSCLPYNASKSGSTWGYTNAEYLIVPTLNYQNGGLQKGKYYYIEIFQAGTASDNLDVVGYEKQPEICGYKQNKPIQNRIYNVKYAQVLLSFDASNTSGWTRYKGYFSPSSDKNWLSFGNSGTWDDLRIYEVQENGCRDNWYFDNTEFNYSTEFFQAGQNIYVGKGVDPENGVNHIAGDVIVRANSHVVLQAGNQVIINSLIMEPGGSVLKIENAPCSPSLCPNELEIDDQQILCGIASKQIGATNASPWGTTVTWSPSTYLDNPNSPNPTFTAPAGSGTINYTVMLTYTCDQGYQYTSSQNVMVQFTHSSDPTATISASNINEATYNYSADFNVSDGVTEIHITSVSSPFSDPPYDETFYLGEDFSNGVFNWSLLGNWSSCQNQEIQVVATNACSGATQSLQLTWHKSGSLDVGQLPNILTVNGDGVNDFFCFNIDHVDQVHLSVENQWGNTVYDNWLDITNSPVCMWNGYDQNSGNQLAEGEYYYVLDVYNECGEQVQLDGFVTIVNTPNGLAQTPNSSKRQQANDLLERNTTTKKETTANLGEQPNRISNLRLVPNPTRNQFFLMGKTDEVTLLEVYTISGKLIITHKDVSKSINLSKYAAGLYFVHLHTASGIKILKVEKQ